MLAPSVCLVCFGCTGERVGIECVAHAGRKVEFRPKSWQTSANCGRLRPETPKLAPCPCLPVSAPSGSKSARSPSSESDPSLAHGRANAVRLSRRHLGGISSWPFTAGCSQGQDLEMPTDSQCGKPPPQPIGNAPPHVLHRASGRTLARHGSNADARRRDLSPGCQQPRNGEE